MARVLIVAVGTFVLWLWLAARTYAAGYLSAMNIPAFYLSWAIWELGEVDWLLVTGYALGTVLVIGLGLNFILARLTPGFAKFVLGLQARVGSREPDGRHIVNRAATGTLTVAYLASAAGMALLTVWASSAWVYGWGQVAGRRAVLERASQVQIVSRIPQAIGTPALTPETAASNASTSFVYADLRLLTHMGSRYFLFKDIDPVTCRPDEVYVVNDQNFLQINFEPATSLAAHCRSEAVQGTNAGSPSPLP